MSGDYDDPPHDVHGYGLDGELLDLPVLDPTHPDGPRKMLDVPVPGADDQPEPAAPRTEPTMSRAERRAVLRYARRQR